MLKLKAFEEKDLKRLGIKLIEGRMPKNEQEILVADATEWIGWY
ncbi:MAG: hypothetical protein ACLROG_04935 [Coprococcus phoceensis]